MAGGQGGQPGQARLWSVGGFTPARARGAADPVGRHLDRLGRLVQELVKSNRSDEQAVEALYLATLTRFPAAEEMKQALEHLARKLDRQEALADLLRALVNSKEFGAATPELLHKLNRHDFPRAGQ
jgi:hypothetical protein